MVCGTRERLERVCGALVRALADRGRLLVLVTHPCFRQADYETFRYDLPEGLRYWDSGAAYDVVEREPGSGDHAGMPEPHWPRGGYVTALPGAPRGGHTPGLRTP